MNTFIIIAILILNAISILLVYQFIKPLEKKEKIIFIVVVIAINYMVVSGVYFLSGIGIEKIVTQSAKSFVTYMFVPVNIILVMPFVSSTYIKVKEKKLKKEVLRNRCIAIAIWAILILIVEYFYFRNIQINIGELYAKK